MRDELKDRLQAIVAASEALFYLLHLDHDDWKALPVNVQNALNEASIACEGLTSTIEDAVQPCVIQAGRT